MSNAKVSTTTVVTPTKRTQKSRKRAVHAQAGQNAGQKSTKPQMGPKVQGANVTVNIASSRKMTSQKPVTMPIKNGVRVMHTELVGPIAHGDLSSNPSILATDLVTLFRLRANPGSKNTFNWLSSLAPNFEFYKFRKLVFIYETRAPSTTPGSLIISPDYDAADGGVAVSEQRLFNNKGTADDSVWKHIHCTLSPASMNRLYKSHVNMSDERFASTAQDQKTIDCAQVFVCLDPGIFTPFKYGKVFVSYDVELTEPQAPTEPVNMGGMNLSIASPAVNWGASGSLQPVLNVGALPITSVFSDVSKIMKTVTELPNITYPTATLGQFTKDYQGIVNIWRGATTVSTSPSLFTGTDPNSTAGSPGDVACQNSTLSLATGAVQFITKIINAKAGEYLKTTAGAYTGPTSNFIMQFAGSGLAGII